MKKIFISFEVYNEDDWEQKLKDIHDGGGEDDSLRDK